MIPTISYRCPIEYGAPLMGTIVMGRGPRTRCAYRVLGARKVRSAVVAIGVVTWKLAVERMSAAAGREEIDAGAPFWSIKWDKRRKRARSR